MLSRRKSCKNPPFWIGFLNKTPILRAKAEKTLILVYKMNYGVNKKRGALLPGAKAKSPCLSANEQVGGSQPTLLSILSYGRNAHDDLRQNHDEQEQRSVDQRLQILPVHPTARVASAVRAVGHESESAEREGQSQRMVNHDHAAIELCAGDGKQSKSNQRADQSLQRAPRHVQKEQSASFCNFSHFAHISLSS